MRLFSKKSAAPDETLEALRGEYQNYRRRTAAQLERAEADGMKKAVLVCCEPQYMDLVIGQDIKTAYLELIQLNHHMRILETVLPRLKRQEAVVLYE